MLSPLPPPPSSFLPCRPVHGLIFLYKWRAEEEPQGSIVKDSRLEEIFFAKQVGHVATFQPFSTANTSDGQLAGPGNKAIGQMLWFDLHTFFILATSGNSQCLCDPGYLERAAEHEALRCRLWPGLDRIQGICHIL